MIRLKVEDQISEKKKYALESIIYHLIRNDEKQKVYELLTSLDYLKQKISHIPISGLFEDIFMAKSVLKKKSKEEITLTMMEKVLEQYSTFLSKEPDNFFQCFWNYTFWEQEYFNEEHIKHPDRSGIKIDDKITLSWFESIKKTPWVRNLCEPIEKLEDCDLIIRAHDDSITDIDVSPDECEIVTVSNDGTARFWDYKTGGLIRSWKSDEKYFTSVKYSPCGTYTALGFGEIRHFLETSIIILHNKTGNQVVEFKGHFRHITDLEFSKCGKYLASISADKTLRVWDVASGEEIHCFFDMKKTPCSLDWSSTGNEIACGYLGADIYSGKSTKENNEKIIKVHLNKLLKNKNEIPCEPIASRWNIKTGKKLWDICATLPNTVFLKYSKDGNSLIVVEENAFGSFKLKKGDKYNKNETKYTIREACIIRNETHLLLITQGEDEKKKLLQSYTLDGNMQFTFRCQGSKIDRLAYINKTDSAVLGGYDGTVRIFNLKKKRVIKKEEDKRIADFKFSPDGNMIVFSYLDETYFDLKKYPSLSPIKRILGTDINPAIHKLCYSPNGKVLLSAGYIYEAWETKYYQKIWSSYVPYEPPLKIVFSPDSKCFAASTIPKKKLFIWCLENEKNEPIFTVDEEKQGVPLDMEIDNMNKTVMATYLDNIRRWWDIESGEERRCEAKGRDAIISYVFHLQKGTLISGWLDKKIKIFDIDTGCKIEEIRIDCIPFRLALTKDRKNLVIQGNKEKCIMIDLENGKKVDETKIRWNLVEHPEIEQNTPIGHYSIDDNLIFVENQTGKEIAKYPKNQQHYYFKSLHPNGKVFGFTVDDRLALLKVEDGKS